MNRRSAIKYLGLGGSAIILGGGLWLTRSTDNSDLNIASTLERLRTLNPEAIEKEGAWEIARTFEHLAQSIEFSMKGFPEMKSTVFRSTIGQLAFAAFNSAGKMTHGLDEVIPGEVVRQSTPNKAIQRLILSLEDFDSFDGVLKPHFAYGSLNKSQYEIAHVMHINNHFEEFLMSSS